MDCFVAALLAMTDIMAKQPAVYIVANRKKGTIYTGVTSDLVARVWQHREGVNRGFTSRYECKRLVWFELHGDMPTAIAREKQIKGGSRQKKINLIEAVNPDWHDLYRDIAHS
jgi:putative endonuclease